MDKRRVVITGMSLLSPIGKNIEEFRSSLHAGKSGIGKITLFNAEHFEVKIAGEIKDFHFSDYFPPDKWPDEWPAVGDRKMQFFLAAMKMLPDDLLSPGSDPGRVGLSLGVGMALFEPRSFREHVLPYIDSNVRKVEKERFSDFRCAPQVMEDEFLYSQYIRYAARFLKIKGPVFINCSACAASTKAIGFGYQVIKDERAEVMIAGGTDAMIHPLGIYLFSSLGALSTNQRSPEEVSRPFDALRDGLVIGEGAGLMVLEDLSHARRYGRKIYGEILGWGSSSDAYHILLPDPEGYGASLSIKRALDAAGIGPEEVDYINAHGTSTIANDQAETKAIKRALGKHAGKVPVSSYKSMFGHLMIAAGVVELIGTVLDLNDHIISPTLNYSNFDPQCDLDYVSQPRHRDMAIAMKQSLGFGGENSAIIVKKYME